MALPWRRGGRLSLKPPAVLMCPRSGGLMDKKEIIWIIGYEGKKEEVMTCYSSSKKHTKRQPYWFSKCSGVPFKLAWRCLWCTCSRDEWTVTTNPQPQGALPGVRCRLFPSCPRASQNGRFCRENTTTFDQGDGRNRLLQTAPGSVLLSTCSVPTCYHFSSV